MKKISLTRMAGYRCGLVEPIDYEVFYPHWHDVTTVKGISIPGYDQFLAIAH
jgi:hypothetical protein